jgi:hypothetical protein
MLLCCNKSYPSVFNQRTVFLAGIKTGANLQAMLNIEKILHISELHFFFFFFVIIIGKYPSSV